MSKFHCLSASIIPLESHCCASSKKDLTYFWGSYGSVAQLLLPDNDAVTHSIFEATGNIAAALLLMAVLVVARVLGAFNKASNVTVSPTLSLFWANGPDD
jgi:hypothetical protein